MRTAAILIFDNVYLRGRLRLTTARQLSAYMVSLTPHQHRNHTTLTLNGCGVGELSAWRGCGVGVVWAGLGESCHLWATVSIHSWDITISGMVKLMTAILEIYYRFRFRPHHSIGDIILHQAVKCHPIQTICGRVMMLYRFLPRDAYA